MTTTRLTIVTSARNLAEEKILAGVYGFTREDGTFEVDANLKDRIYMFSLMAAKPLPGLQTQTLEIDEQHANALRATLTAALGRRWAQAYADLTGQHELAQAEAHVVSNAVAAAIASMGQPAYRVQMSKSFNAIQAEYVAPEYDDDGYEGFDTNPACYRIDAAVVVGQTTSIPWSVTSAQPLIITNEGFDQNHLGAVNVHHFDSQGVDTNYASGTLKATTVVYGASDEARKAVLDVISSLPEKLLNEVIGKDALGIEGVSWHSPADVTAMVRSRVAAGERVSVQEMALLSPHEDQNDRLIWAEGVMASQALYQAQQTTEEEINLTEAAQAAAPGM